MELITIIIVVLIFIICYSIDKAKDKAKKIDNVKTLNAIQTKYRSLINEVVSSYDLKVCPKCFEKTMSLLTISTTGQSVNYECEYCHKKLTSKILPGKDGTGVALKFNEIQSMLGVLIKSINRDFLKREINVSFIVNTNFNNPIENQKRIPIPESVRNKVWRRDQGKCVECGSNEKLEFDHIIPVSKGGSSTARNIRLLCEICNRKKGNKI